MLNYQDEAEAKRSKPGWKFPSEFRIQFNKILQPCRMVLKSCKMVQNVGYWRSHQWRNCTSLSEEANWKLQLGRQLMSGILIHCCKVAFIWLLMHGDSDGPREWRGEFFACRNLGSWIPTRPCSSPEDLFLLFNSHTLFIKIQECLHGRWEEIMVGKWPVCLMVVKLSTWLHFSHPHDCGGLDRKRSANVTVLKASSQNGDLVKYCELLGNDRHSPSIGPRIRMTP